MPQKIGFQYSAGDFETVPLEQINNTEDNSQQEEDTKLLSDFIPGAVYDGSGNIVTQESFKTEIKRNKAEARHFIIGLLFLKPYYILVWLFLFYY